MFGSGARGWTRVEDTSVPMVRTGSQRGALATPVETPVSNMFSALMDHAEAPAPPKKEVEMEAEAEALPPKPSEPSTKKLAKGDLMSVEQAERKGEAAIKEFFGPESDIDELIHSWEEFSGPSAHAADDDILDKWFFRAYDINFSKGDDPRIYRFGRALARMVNEKIMSSETLEKCLMRQSEMLEDLVPDAPLVFNIFGVIVGQLVARNAVPMAMVADLCQALVDSPSKVPQGENHVEYFICALWMFFLTDSHLCFLLQLRNSSNLFSKKSSRKTPKPLLNSGPKPTST